MTRLYAGCFLFLTLIQWSQRPMRYPIHAENDRLAIDDEVALL
jgi:hypothetical protein